MMHSGARMVSGFLLAAAVFSGMALAQPTPDQTSAIQSNCRGDFLSKCSGVKRGGIEAFECLKKNEAALSAGCKAAVGAVNLPSKEAPKQAEPAPAPAPVPKPAVPPVAAPAAPKPPAAPSASKASSVKSAEPKAEKKQAAPRLKEKPAAGPAIEPPKPAVTEPAEPRLTKQEEEALIRQSCSLDYGLNCFGVPYGEGRILACLRQNAAKLTAGCSAAIKLVGPR